MNNIMFSIIYNKKFVVFGNCDKNIKVKEVLNQFGLNISFRETKNIEKILNNSNFDFVNINKKAEETRQESLKYLFDSIENIKD